MKKTIFLTQFLVVASALFAICLGILLLDKINGLKAQMNEYEWQIADIHAEKERCIKRLGVFYMPEKGKGG